MKRIYDHSKDPVFVGESRSGKSLFLQIGESKTWAVSLRGLQPNTRPHCRLLTSGKSRTERC